MRLFVESDKLSSDHIHSNPHKNMRSTRNYSLEAFIAKASRDDAKTHREMGHATPPKGAHTGKEVSNHSKTAAGREPTAR